MEKFWEWLRYYANQKVRDYYMAKVHHERKCECCNTWTSEVGGCAKLEEAPDDSMCELMTCKKCGHVSRWDCRGMLPTLVVFDG
jgi:hypothetical protein